jgi:hypothetical protein
VTILRYQFNFAVLTNDMSKLTNCFNMHWVIKVDIIIEG